MECCKLGGLIPALVKPTPIKLIYVSSLLSTQHYYGARTTNSWLGIRITWQIGETSLTCGQLFQWASTNINQTHIKTISPDDTLFTPWWTMIKLKNWIAHLMLDNTPHSPTLRKHRQDCVVLSNCMMMGYKGSKKW